MIIIYYHFNSDGRRLIIISRVCSVLTAGGTVEPSNLFTEEEEIRHNCPIEIPLWRLRVVLRIMNLETAIKCIRIITRTLIELLLSIYGNMEQR